MTNAFVWEIYEVRKGIWAFLSWLWFTDADWLDRQTPITWLSLLNCSSVKGSHDWSCSYCQFFRFISAKEGLEVDIKVGNRTCWQKDNRIRFLEHVEIQLSLRFRRQGSLQVFLTSPRGTKSNMIPKRKYDKFPAIFSNFTVDSVQFWGEDPLGTWKLGFRNFNPDRDYTGKYCDASVSLISILSSRFAQISMHQMF